MLEETILEEYLNGDNQTDSFLATHNLVFNTYNVSYLMTKLSEFSKLENIEEFGAVAFNIRNLSFINEEFGRNLATEMLADFIAGLQKLLTEEKEILAHFGGDNFIALVSTRNMDSFLNYLAGTKIKSESGATVLFSAWVGVYVPKDLKKEFLYLVDSAMFALNTAKKERREIPLFFNEEKKKQLEESKWVRSQFDEAIKKEEFQVYYQPKVCLKNYTLSGAEALCRWNHEGKLISPGVFIPPLEESSGIVRLDYYMLEHVCSDIRRWLDEGKTPVRISVNLSRRHFGDQKLLQHIVEIIDRYKVPHKYIEIELTETSTAVELKELKTLLFGLKKQGINTSMDDFGTGYSSLNLIRELPWSVIKLDKSFLDSEGTDSRKAQMMFSHVIALARELGMECITEGIETVEQVKMLKENNCYHAQGFYFDRPIPVDQFEKRLC
ncbi:MAG: EAL domain-containing protein [Treponema sp.]|nr:EAL domain-containing protein [Treponema sp.]